MSDDENNFQYYGTLLEPYDEDEIPKKKAFSIEDQVATDEQGRRRFHGAFTGGFSAGFFNTVGSLEGWKPAEFKSSRSEKAERKSQRPQDFMDDEDVGQFGIAPSVVQATSDYDSVKRNKRSMKTDGPIPGVPVLHSILQPAKETVGIRLLKKMGWKPGQGVGPRVTKVEKKRINKENNSGKVYGCEIPEQFRRPPQSESDTSSDEGNDITFAPDDYDPFIYKPKDNTFGMGYSGLDKRPILSSHINLFAPNEFKMQDHKNNKISISGQAFGVGAFEHEDEDIYVGEDMTKYDFELDSAARKNKKTPKIKNKSKEENEEEHVLDGFSLASNPVAVKKSFPAPTLPKSFIPKHGARISRFEPLPETHKMYNFDRKKTLGRHDLTAEQRSKIINPLTNVITITNESKKELLISKTLDTSLEKEKQELKEKAAKITNLLSHTPVGPFKPFMTNPEKQKRYEEYITLCKINQQDKISDIQPPTMSENEKEHEKYEFAQASRMFKPVMGLVFDKFVTASSTDDTTNPLELVGRSVYEHGTQDMRDAAEKKLFGQLTRVIEVWRPHKLLCKRFNVPDPDISETEMVLARKRKNNKYSVFDYYEAYQQNKTIKDGPTPKPVLETKEIAEEIPTEPIVEIIPALERYISKEKVAPVEPQSTITSNTCSVDIVENKLLDTPSTSSSIPILESVKFHKESNLIVFTNKEKQNSSQNLNKFKEKIDDPYPEDPIEKSNSRPVVPTDPKEKRDLFKAIFLSSSDESEDEKEEIRKKNQEKKITEMKKLLLDKEPEKPPPINQNKANKGIFADLDWSKINRRKDVSSTDGKNETEEIQKKDDNATEKKKIAENEKKEDENLFGPKLPAQIPKQTTTTSPSKPLFTNKKSAKDSSSSDDEWMEADSSVEKSSKKSVKKHKKHKSKHKKHKSKHKKKKHSDKH